MNQEKEKSKKIVIIGGGLSGCTIAYLFRQSGYNNIMIIEKDDDIGGLCRTYKKRDNKYEFGPHVFHSDKQDVSEIAKKLMDYHEVRPIVRACPFNDINRLFDYPLTISSILNLENKEEIVLEFYNLCPKILDPTNFETYVKSMIGPTLYEIFIKNYNIKQWGIHPKNMSSKWAPKRISLRKNNKLLFHNMWSIYPTDGFTSFFKKLTKGVQIIRGEFIKLINESNITKGIKLKNGTIINGDIFISTIPIDLLLNSSKKLSYRGVYKSFIQVKRKKILDGLWYTFPNHHHFTRIMEYKGYTLEDNDTTILSAAFPFNMKEINTIPVNKWDSEFKITLMNLFNIAESEIINQFGMKGEYAYPSVTVENERIFNDLLNKLVTFENLFSIGRLGLFIYIPMYVCMKQAIRLIKLIEEYKNLNIEERINNYFELR
ncbi:MAG: protoporphyrinogen/coproporphyrinogen oxidase [Candidatus Hodarchaeota archaeon]